MEIKFGNRRIEKELIDERLMKSTYTKFYSKLLIVMSQLYVAKSLKEISTLPPLKRHKLNRSYEGCWAVWVSRNFRLIFKADEDCVGLDESEITKISIIEIEDYH